MTVGGAYFVGTPDPAERLLFDLTPARALLLLPQIVTAAGLSFEERLTAACLDHWRRTRAFLEMGCCCFHEKTLRAELLTNTIQGRLEEIVELPRNTIARQRALRNLIPWLYTFAYFDEKDLGSGVMVPVSPLRTARTNLSRRSLGV